MGAELDVALRSPQLEPEARETLESAREEVDRMSGIVQDLLVLARIDSGQMRLLEEPLDIGVLAGRRAAAFVPLALRRGSTLSAHVEPSARGAEVRGDRERLEQVLNNLLDNATRHTPAGGSVTVDVWRRGGEVGFTVSDSGPGIPSEALPHVFDRFYRVEPRRSDLDGGSGLGLAIVREIVLAHGGRVWAESRNGSGSDFSVALPFVERDVERA
jgi:two-component system sensor histidine kinase ResE